tara:strand:- start:11320 stop:11661 length:342 start_codon:yes stop_codon:yes gene_type:complete
MAISWNFYTKKRKVSVTKLLAENRITTYEGLCSFLKLKGVAPPPTFSEVERFGLTKQGEQATGDNNAPAKGKAPEEVEVVNPTAGELEESKEVKPSKKKAPSWKRKKPAAKKK